MIESAVWTNIHNGVSLAFNDDSLPFEIFSTEVAWRQEADSKPQEHGEFGGLPYLGNRLFHAEGDILQQDSASYITKRRQLVKSVLPSGRYGNEVVGTLDLLFTGMTETLRSYCSLDGWPELPMEALGPAHGKYMINWKSFDPRMYSLVLYQTPTGTPGVSYGRTYPRTYPKSYSTPTGVLGDAVITNAGDMDVYPVIQITGPSTAPYIVLLSHPNQPVVEFGNLVLTTGESVTVDFENRTAIHSNGSDVYYTITRREWWALDSGANTVRYSAFSVGSGSIATIQWRNAYMV